MSDHEIAEFCREKFRQFDEHKQESIGVRDDVKTSCNALGWLTKRIDAIEASSLSIKVSLIGIVFAIIMQIGGFLYLWGMQSKQLEINTEAIAHHSVDIETLKDKSYGYRGVPIK